jgi:hypothetical protein
MLKIETTQSLKKTKQQLGRWGKTLKNKKKRMERIELELIILQEIAV